MAATFTAAAAAAAAAATVMLVTNSDSKTLLSSSTHTTKLEAHECAALKEPATGILFDALCNGYTLVGTGVRVKYGLIKVYAVGTYIDSNAVATIKNDSAAAIEAALLNVNVPRTIRIVMNRKLGIQKYTEAIVEALTPRMHGQDLDKLDEFKRLNPPIDLEKGTRAVVLSRDFLHCVRGGHAALHQNISLAHFFFLSLSHSLRMLCMCACISLLARARPRCMPCLNYRCRHGNDHSRRHAPVQECRGRVRVHSFRHLLPGLARYLLRCGSRVLHAQGQCRAGHSQTLREYVCGAQRKQDARARVKKNKVRIAGGCVCARERVRRSVLDQLQNAGGCVFGGPRFETST
jgi:hypothetical protein